MTRAQFIAQNTRINRKYEDQFMPVIQRAIHHKVEAVISRLRHSGVDSATTYLSTDMTNDKLADAITQLYLTIGKKHAQLNYSRLLHETRRRKSVGLQLETKGFGFNAQWAKFILDYLNRFLTTKITFDIADTTRKALLTALATMTYDGLSVDQMIERLQEWPYERYQAARIVRTEVNRAANTGAKAQAHTSEWQQLKEWIAINDFRTRGQNPKDHASHIGLDGVKIDEDDMFTDPRNGDRLDVPGDPNAKAESTINCRCQVAYTFKRDINGNLIPKRKSTVVIYPSRRDQQIITI